MCNRRFERETQTSSGVGRKFNFDFNFFSISQSLLIKIAKNY